MRKHLSFLFALFLTFGATTTLTACGGSDDNEPTVVASIKASTGILQFDGNGGSQTITIESSQEWGSYTSDDSWISINPANSTSKNATVTVTVAKNTLLTPRTGSITLQCGAARATIEISQAEGDGSEDPNAKTVPNAVADAAKYKLVWNDEFDQSSRSLDANNWTHEVQRSGWVNNELQNYVNETSPSGRRVTEVKNGKLYINCFKDDDGKVYSGRVYGKVKQGWQYGYVEARIKLPSGKGTWPAFWMMPVNFKSWPDDGEIDIMEEVGYHKDYVSSSLHATGHVHSNNTQVTKEVYCKGAEGDFHVYGMEWTPNYFQFYVDGEKTLYYANPGTGKRDWPYDAPFYVILNLAWGGSWGGSQGVDNSVVEKGVTMEVEYVRVFQK